jgi:hypothetical protein
MQPIVESYKPIPTLGKIVIPKLNLKGLLDENKDTGETLNSTVSMSLKGLSAFGEDVNGDTNILNRTTG